MKKPEKEHCKKILIEAMHGLGDVVCMLPMMKEIREAFPDAFMTVMVNKPMVTDLLMSSDVRIDEVISINAHEDKIAFLKECCKLRGRKYDLSISAAHTPVRKAKAMMAIVGAKRKAGIQYSHGTNYDGLNDRYHFVEANLLILGDLGICSHHFAPRLVVDDQAAEKFRCGLDPRKVTVGMCIGKADISYRDKGRKHPVYTRCWGEHEMHVSNMAELIRLMLGEGWQVVLFGGTAEETIRDALPDEIMEHPACHDYVGKTTLPESVAMTGICDVVVGIDTGMQHIADAAGRKTVSLFGPTNPRTHGAYSNRAAFVESDTACRCCYGTSLYVQCEDRKCMKCITPQRVFEAAKEAVHGALEMR